MEGHAVGLAAMATAAVVLARAEQPSTSVIAFAKDALVLQAQGETRPPAALVDDLLSLRGKGRTDLALALRTASAQLARRPGGRALTRSSSPTAGRPPERTRSPRSRASIESTSWVRATTRNPSRRAARSPSRARGCYRSATSYVRLQAGLLTLLS